MGSFDDQGILRGWKEIEAFLGMRRKAILRHGYPVHRPSDGGAVCASKKELIQHMRQLPVTR